MNSFWEWTTDLIYGFASAFEWLITPLNSELDGIFGITTTPLFLVTFSGLVLFLGVAIVRWFV